MQASETAENGEQLVAKLKDIVGSRHVITNPRSMERFCKGFLFGDGSALGVVLPGSLLEDWLVL